MQTYGWDQGTIFASDTLQEIADPIEGKPAKYAGTMGESKRMEALRLNVELPESEKDAVIKVRAHVQTYGWDKEFTVVDTTGKETAVVGTTGASKRMEAVQISATGLKDYRILYRAHVQGIGWQDWVDASDPTSYAGTIAQSKRVEALEIAIVDADDYTYEHNNTQVGTHTVSYKGKVMGIEECAYGDWESETTGSLSLVRKCSLCGHEDTEKYTLSGALKDSLKNGGNGVVTVNDVTIGTNEELAVPTKNTLVVKNKLTVNGNLAVDGSIVAFNVDGNGTVKTNDGASFKVEGKYPDAAALAKFLGYDFLTGIEFFEGSGNQTISTTAKVTNTKLTVDLNETAVTFNGTGYMIENSGDLTINDGKFTTSSGNGIETEGNLTINGGSIESKEQAVRLGSTTPLTSSVADKDIKDYNGVKVTLNEVELKTTDSSKYGVVAIGNNANITLNDCKLDATGLALGTNNRTTGAGFTVNGGEVKSAGVILAYLPAEGTNTFSGVKLTATSGAGIEVASGTLTLKNKTVLEAKDTTAGTTLEDSATLASGAADDGGYGILVKLKAGYGKEDGTMKVSIDNSTITSTSDYAVAVVEDNTARSKMDSVNVAITKSTITGGKTDNDRKLPILTNVLPEVKEGDVVTTPAVKVNISYTK